MKLMITLLAEVTTVKFARILLLFNVYEKIYMRALISLTYTTKLKVTLMISPLGDDGKVAEVLKSLASLSEN